jgi:arginyl-tRNA synthetase
MVDLPSGKMKSREGTVVDADELMDDMINTARETTKALGKTDGMEEKEAEELYHTIGLGALKYFILKVDPKKRMLFDPKESIDFNGNTGPFIQYTYARIKSVLRKAGDIENAISMEHSLAKEEKAVISLLHDFPKIISEAAAAYNPGHVANYVYDLAKAYNHFYHEIPILKSENAEDKSFRLHLSVKTADTIKTSLQMLGIKVAERM